MYNILYIIILYIYYDIKTLVLCHTILITTLIAHPYYNYNKASVGAAF